MNEVAIFGLTDLQSMASTMAVSGMFGKNKEQLLALMLIAQAEGIHPAIAAMEYDIIQNRPALKGQAALARFQQSGGRIDWIVRTDAEAKAKFSHPQGGVLEVSWTMERARKMGLDQKDNWKKQPGVMLSWRCVAEGVRAVYPACLNRMYLAEEVQDFEPMRTVSTLQAEPESIVLMANQSVCNNDDKEREELEAYRKKASELTKKAGFTDDDKAAMYVDCGKDIKVYCEKLEAILAMPAPEPTEPEFALDGTPPVQLSDIMVELEEYEQAESTPVAARGDIQNAFARKETDIKKLTDLLNRVKTACKK